MHPCTHFWGQSFLTFQKLALTSLVQKTFFTKTSDQNEEWPNVKQSKLKLSDRHVIKMGSLKNRIKYILEALHGNGVTKKIGTIMLKSRQTVK
jgi:hypothetical protein